MAPTISSEKKAVKERRNFTRLRGGLSRLSQIHTSASLSSIINYVTKCALSTPLDMRIISANSGNENIALHSDSDSGNELNCNNNRNNNYNNRDIRHIEERKNLKRANVFAVYTPTSATRRTTRSILCNNINDNAVHGYNDSYNNSNNFVFGLHNHSSPQGGFAHDEQSVMEWRSEREQSESDSDNATRDGSDVDDFADSQQRDLELVLNESEATATEDDKEQPKQQKRQEQSQQQRRGDVNNCISQEIPSNNKRSSNNISCRCIAKICDMERLQFKMFADLCEIRNGSGLLSIALKTLQLVKRNQLLQRRLLQLQLETADFMRSVLANPENRHLRAN